MPEALALRVVEAELAARAHQQHLDDREAVDEVAVRGGQRVAHRRAVVVPDHADPVEAERLGEQADVAGDGALVVAGRGLRGVARARAGRARSR